MTQKLKNALFYCFLLAPLGWFCCPASAQDTLPLAIQKSTVNAETETPEFCLDFNKELAPLSLEKLGATLRMESNGKTLTPSNIVAMGSSLCLFPLERNTPYRLTLKGLKGSQNERLAAPHVFSFSIPDRSPSLAFSTENGSIEKFGAFDSPLTLRSVNIEGLELQAYQITKPSVMARAWQDRKLIALAPSEVAALARNEGTLVWKEKQEIPLRANVTTTQKISLREKIPNLPPGLFLIVADTKTAKTPREDKGLAPLAAAWITNSAFSLRAVRDSEGVHSVISRKPQDKEPVRLMAFADNSTPLVETEEKSANINFMPISSPPKEGQDVAVVIGQDSSGNVAFAPIEFLSPASRTVSYPGALHIAPSYAAPLTPIDAFLSPMAVQKEAALKTTTVLRLSAGNLNYSDFPVAPSKAKTPLKTSFIAPPMPGTWSLRWQRTDGAILAQTALRVSTASDTAHLHVSTESNELLENLTCPLTIRSHSSAGTPIPLVNGRIFVSWEKLDSTTFPWREYQFGNSASIKEETKPVADFLTDLDGTASLRLNLPPPPENLALYQARIKFAPAYDTSLVEADDIIVPLRSGKTVVGVKPLAAEAHFPQNSVAQFALIALSPEGKPRDMADLFYQVYEEGRSFDWYQDEGRWKYKPEARLRPIGGGSLSINADNKSLIEWPVTAGKYRLAVINRQGKILAQTPFSAGWDSSGLMDSPTESLGVSLPKRLVAGQEVLVRITLPEPALITAVVSDSRVRKIVHEHRPKGDSLISFTPAEDWAKDLRLSVETLSLKTGKTLRPIRRYAVRDLLIAEEGPKTEQRDPHEISVAFVDSPSSFLFRKGDPITLPFVIRNNANKSASIAYSFKTSPGIKLAGDVSGEVFLQGNEAKTLSLSLTGSLSGEKLLRFEMGGRKTRRTSLSWPLAVLSQPPFLKSARSLLIEPGKNLPPAAPSKSQKEKTIFLSRLPLNGTPEILSHVFNARPFTTEELALTLKTLHGWKEAISLSGIAPQFVVEQRERDYLIRLLQHQNPDGGFGPYRGKDSTLAHTATALMTLGHINKPQETTTAKTFAVSWIKQQLSNTWVDESAREERAAAYAALAAVGAIDAASLHYFSDTSATKILSPAAKAYIASAFKLIQETEASTFWLEKARSEDSENRTISTLQALSLIETPPLADVLAAMNTMTKEMSKNKAPELRDAAALLNVISVRLLSEQKSEISKKKERLPVVGLLVLSANEAALYKNTSSDRLYVTFVSEENAPPAPPLPETKLSQHVYRLNGVELPLGTSPIEGEIYLMEIKASKLPEGIPLLIQHGGNAFRPLGCPLSPQLNALSFIPWLASSGLPVFEGCEISSDGLGFVLPPQEKGKGPVSFFFFARITADSISKLPAPRIRQAGTEGQKPPAAEK